MKWKNKVMNECKWEKIWDYRKPRKRAHEKPENYNERRKE